MICLQIEKFAIVSFRLKNVQFKRRIKSLVTLKKSRPISKKMGNESLDEAAKWNLCLY